MSNRVVLFFLALAGLFVLMLLVATAFVAFRVFGREGVSSRVVIDTTFSGSLVEDVPDDAIARVFMEDVMTTVDVVSALHHAAEDDRVVALVAKIDSPAYGAATLQEVRDAVLHFRASGKPTIAWAETFGEFAPGNGAYYLATAFESIYLLPSGDVGLVGLNAEVPFVRGILDKLDITPQFDHRYEYKNAMNFYTETKLTDAHREATQALVTSIFDQFVAGIAEGRDLAPEEVKALVDRGPFLGPEALDAGLVDALLYEDEVESAVDDRVGADANWLSLSAYHDRAGGAFRGGDTVALIYGVGAVQRGESGYAPLEDMPVMGSTTVTGAFRDAVDADVAAIVFRIDCPGGSYVASDAIRREVVRATEAGIPVIVSMGNVAASGGYFVAMDATRIVAQPGTITGSIGVLAGKLILSGFYDKIGLSFDSVQTSDNATMWSANERFDEAEWERFQAWLDRIYTDFTNKVAAGRDIPIERVLEIAKGRVWVGETAATLGLVDELGGLPTAIAAAREEAGLSADRTVRLRRFPERPSFVDLLRDRLRSRGRMVDAGALHELVKAIRPVLASLSDTQPLRMAPVDVDGR